MSYTATHLRAKAEAPGAPSSVTSVWAKLFAPVDIAALVYFRVAFAAILLWELWRYFDHDWIRSYWITPTFHFTYYGFAWVTPWPGNWMYAHFGLLALCTLCLGLGYYTRYSALLVFGGFTYIFLLDQATYLNHFYLLCWVSFLLIWLPSGRAFSLDVLLGETITLQQVPAWTLWLLRFQIGVAYFFGGVAKFNGDWLRGEPMRSWLAQQRDFPIIGPYFSQEWMVYLFAYGGLIFDLLIVFLLLWRKTRAVAVLLVLFFHLTNAQLFSIGIFPWFMIAVTPLFFPAEWPRQISQWLLYTATRSKPKSSSRIKLELGATHFGSDSHLKPTSYFGAMTKPTHRSLQPVSSLPTRKEQVIMLALACYVIIQVSLPFRHLLYPGIVHWTEEGHNFAWHMKLRDKTSQAHFTVVDPASGQRWTIDNRAYLSRRQASKMSTRPDLILQFAHHLANIYRQQGHPQAEVYANVLVSLNGRQPQWLIDPTVNLAAQPRNLWPAPWIVPLQEALTVQP